MFLEILRLFNVKAIFPYSGNTFFNRSHIWLVEADFLSGGNCFLIAAIFLLVEAIIGIREESVFKGKAYYCQWATDFLASGNHFLLYIFQRFFSVQWKRYSRKSFVPASGNGFYSQQCFLQEERKAVNQRILFSLNKKSDSIRRNEGFVRKIRFQYAEKLLYPQ